jgi:hypothetical protein
LTIPLSTNYLIANTIGPQSFVSFDATIQFHGLFDQRLSKYRSASKKQYIEKIEEIKYKYITVKNKNFFGFKSIAI